MSDQVTQYSSVNELMSQPHWSLFEPTTKGDLLIDYPELRAIEEFMALDNPRKMLFVYYYACKISNARKLVEDSDRIKYAMMHVWGDNIPADIEKKYMAKQWGSDVSAAIRAMRAYEPEPRIMMKLACQQIMDRLKDVLDRPAPSQDSDWSDVQKYIQAMKVATELMGEIKPYTEAGAFGVTQKSESNLRRDGAIMAILRKSQ